MREWRLIPWRKLERRVFKLQTRIFKPIDGMGVKQMVHYDKPGKPKRGHPPSRMVYHPQASLTLNVTVVAMHQQLCLLVCNLGQRQLRQTLQQANQTLPNYLGKATQCPTLRWVFQCLMALLLAVLKVILILLCQVKVRNMGYKIHTIL